MKKQIGEKEMITVSSVANATRGELLCITYEILLENIKLAQLEVGEKRKDKLKKGVEVIQLLTEDLDFEIALSKELFSLYVYVQGLLVKDKSEEEIDRAYSIIDRIYQSFLEISKNEMSSGPSMQNAEVVYAGMTYGRDDLNEISLKDVTRGFKA